MLPRPSVPVDVVVPYSRGDLVSRVHTDGEIDVVEYVETGTRIVGRADAALAAELRTAALPDAAADFGPFFSVTSTARGVPGSPNGMDAATLPQGVGSAGPEDSRADNPDALATPVTPATPAGAL